MFRENKTAFGQPGATTFGFGAGATTGVTPFGAAGMANTAGATAFGKPATAPGQPVFGAGATTSLFGGAAAGTPGGGAVPQGTSLFGGGSSGTTFGMGHQTQPAFGGFSSTTTTPNIFGAATGTAGTGATAGGGLFGVASTSTASVGGQQVSTSNAVPFGSAPKQASAFGTLGGFGQTAPGTQQAGGGLFGSTSGGMFSTGFGSTPGAATGAGTPVKFSPLMGTDSMVKNGAQQTINTRHQCITCMKEYESKSLEELRMEDYAAGRRGGGVAGGIVGPTNSVVTPGFGATGGVFGGGTTGTTTNSLFGNPVTGTTPAGGFSAATTTSANSGFSFSVPGSNLFGAPNANKPFGAAAPQPNTLFGGGSTTNTFGTQPMGFSSFGQQNQSIGLFGQAKSPFATAGTPGLGFGAGATQNPNAAAQPSQGTGLFAAPKPATPTNAFGTPNAFGAATSSAPPSFGNTFGATGTSTTPGNSIFGQPFKPATTGAFTFGPTTQPNTLGTSLSLGQPSIFGNTATKAGATGVGGGLGTGASMFGGGTTGTSGTGIFGGGANPGTGLGGGTTTFGTANTTLGLGTGGSSMFGGSGTLGGGLGTSLGGGAQLGQGMLGTSANTGLLGGGSGGLGGTSNPTQWGTGQSSGLGLQMGNQMGGGILGSSMNTPFLGGTQFGSGGLGGTGSLGIGSLGGSVVASAGTGGAQHVMSVSSLPFGDSRLFRDLLPSSAKLEEVLKTTNPAAQKALMAGNQFKVSPHAGSTGKVKVKPLGASALSKRSLFDGLEEEDASLLNVFSPRTGSKRLTLKPKPPGSSNLAESSPNTSVNSVSTPVGASVNGPRLSLRARLAGSSNSQWEKESPGLSSEAGSQWLRKPPSSLKRDSALGKGITSSALQNSNHESAHAINDSASDLENTIADLRTRLDSSGGTPIGRSPPHRKKDLDYPSVAGMRDRSRLDGGEEEVDGEVSSSVELAGEVGGSGSIVRETLSGVAEKLRGPRVEGEGREGEEEDEEEGVVREPHPTGIILRRSGYYTIPSMDELAAMVEEVEDGDGSKTVSVVVENFTVGREGYGNVFFFDSFDVAGLNLDEIVHFRHKEIVVYPGDGDDEEEDSSSTNQGTVHEKKVDDSKKPPVGSGLNRRAQVTLDRVWPIDKVTRSPVSDPDRLATMDYEGKLRRVCAQMRTRFAEYRPQTGSWVFKVDHFSKYGLSDSDEDDCPPFPPLSAAPGAAAAAATAASNVSARGSNQVMANGAVSKKIKRLPLQPRDSGMSGHTVDDQMDQSMAEEASMDLSRTDAWPMDGSLSSRGKRAQPLSPECQNGFHENGIDAAVALSPTAQIAQQLGTSTHKVQLMKASFFGDEGEEVDGQVLDRRPLDQLAKHQRGMFMRDKKGVREMEEVRSTPGGDLFRTQFSCRDPTFFSQIKSKRGLGGDSEHHPLVRGPPHGMGGPPSTLSSSSTSQFLLPLHETPSPLLQPVSIPLASKGSSASSRPSVIPPHPLIHRSKMAVLKHRGKHMKHAELVKRLLPEVENQSMLLADLKLYSGRAFRSGWGPGMKLSVLTSARVAAESASKPQELYSRLVPLSNGRSTSDSSGLVMQQLQLLGGTTDTAALQGWIEPHLWVQLQHSDIAYDDAEHEDAMGRMLDEEPGLGGPCPRFSPRSGQEIIHAHCDLCHCGDEDAIKSEDPDVQISSFSRLVWDLCCALWGRLPELEDGSSEEVYLSSHRVSMARRKALSDWLQQAANEGGRGRKGVLRGQGNDNAHTEAVFNLLTRRHLLEACEASQRKGDHFVALMLAGGGWDSRVQLRKQLSAWSRVGADEFIGEGRMKLMALKAGAPLLPTNAVRHGIVDCCWGLDWKRAFAMHLWYVYSPVCSITDALVEYEAAFSSDPKHSVDYEDNEGGPLAGKSYAPAPAPHYMEVEHIKRQMELGAGEKPPYFDLCFHLLKLYSCRSHSLEALLNTPTHTPDPLDVRLSWLLCGALGAIGYSHLAAESEASLHQSMAALLESHGMWHWALFPLLHLKNSKRRKASVMDVLGRHVRISGVDIESEKEYEQREQFVINGLHVPSAWVYSAKAKLAAALHRYGDAAWCLAKAGLWNECHVIILKHIAADAIINENLDYLRDLLAQLAPEERSRTVSGWSCGGQVFWDYLEVLSEIETLMKRGSKEVDGGMDVCVNENYCMERLQPKLSSLCSRLIALPCKTAKERLCRSEISKRIAHVVRALVLMMGGVDSSGTSLQASRVLAYLVTQLPMPPDYLIQELRHLVEVYLDRVTATEDG